MKKLRTGFGRLPLIMSDARRRIGLSKNTPVYCGGMHLANEGLTPWTLEAGLPAGSTRTVPGAEA